MTTVTLLRYQDHRNDHRNGFRNFAVYRETCKRENSNFWIRQTVPIGADTGHAGWFGAVLVYDKGVSTLHGRRSDGDEHSRRHEHEIFHRLHAIRSSGWATTDPSHV